MTDYVRELLNKKWTKLFDKIKKKNNKLNYDKINGIENSKYPGVYLLSYTNKDLENEKINLKDIFYVGMSNFKGGVKQRLKQFVSGIEKEHLHSGAIRFYKKTADNKAYSKFPKKKTFYVVIKTMICNVEKNERKADDLRKMGHVVKLEYDVLARIKEKLEKEPKLNLR